MALELSQNIAENYDIKSWNIQQKWYHELLSCVDIMPGFKCLDIGCGTGKNSAFLAEQVGTSGRVIAIDPDSDRIEFGLENYKQDNLDFRLAKCVDIPPIEGGYDFAISNAVMHWVKMDAKKETYHKLLTFLKPGAHFALLELQKTSDHLSAILSLAPPEAHEISNQLSFINLETSKAIFVSMGYDVVRADNLDETFTYPSLQSYFEWIDATFHGKINSEEIYRKHGADIPMLINEKGEVQHPVKINRIIVKRSEI